MNDDTPWPAQTAASMHHERVIDELVWRTSSRCATGGCVAVAQAGDVYVRDSTAGTGVDVLRFPAKAWAGFVAAVSRESTLAENAPHQR